MEDNKTEKKPYDAYTLNDKVEHIITPNGGIMVISKGIAVYIGGY